MNSFLASFQTYNHLLLLAQFRHNVKSSVIKFSHLENVESIIYSYRYKKKLYNWTSSRI